MTARPPAIPHPPEGADCLWRRRRLTPGRTALVDRARDARLTYAELDRAADRWRGALWALGVRPGDRVAVLARNRPEHAELLHACRRAGAGLVPLNWRLAAPELAAVLDGARPRVLLGEGRFRALAEAAWREPGGRLVDLDEEAPALVARASPAGHDHPGAPDDAALVLYTSGSTGRPKGALIPRRQLHWNALATCASWALGPSDVAAVATPLFHTAAWNAFATPLWHAGGTVVLFDGFDADDWLAGLAAERCTVAFAVPTQVAVALESRSWGIPLPDLRYVLCGGASCPRGVADRVRAAGYRLREAYGLTECGPNCFATTDEVALARPGSVGWPIRFLDVRVAADGGRLAEPHETGELQLRGPQLFRGYLDDPVRTAEALTPDGWLRTGDLAWHDEDGCHSIRGRRTDMYVSGGENVFPGEVEAAIAECAGVAEVVVVGVPDARWGEVGRAYVVRRAGRPLAPADVEAHARERLAGYKVPRTVVLLDEIPKLGTGKPDRAALHAAALGSSEG